MASAPLFIVSLYFHRAWWGSSSSPLWSWAEVRSSLWLLPWWSQHQEWRPAYSNSSYVSVCITLLVFYDMYCWWPNCPVDIFYGNCYLLVRMLKTVARLCSLRRQQTAALHHFIMSCLNVQRAVYLLNQRWEMHFCSGAWSLMDPWIPQACMVTLLDLWCHAMFSNRQVLCHSTLILLFFFKFPLGGCPVIKGNKWSSTKWMRVHEYKV
jgi:hypothetical protein